MQMYGANEYCAAWSGSGDNDFGTMDAAPPETEDDWEDAQYYGSDYTCGYEDAPFEDAVRSVSIRQTGLKVNESVNTTALLPVAGLRGIFTMSAASCGKLRSAIGVSGNRKVYLNSASTIGTFLNGNNFPVLMTYWILEPKRRLRRGPADILSNVRVPLANPLSDGGARERFALVGKRVETIQPGQQGVVRLNRVFEVPRLITYDVDFRTTFTYTPLSLIAFCTFEAPLLATTGPEPEESLLRYPGVKMNIIVNEEVTYYEDTLAVSNSTADVFIAPRFDTLNVFTKVHLRANNNDNGEPDVRAVLRDKAKAAVKDKINSH